jgi:Zn finger protein HypA/HybF involved in hydrogenase expression
MAKFDAVMNRLYRRVFVCKACKTKIRTDTVRVLAGAVKCRRCGGKAFRVIKSKSKAGTA